MSEANVIKALQCDFISFCTDMGPLLASDALVHPRGSGAFPRILARYVRELEIVPLERVIARMTAVAANDLKLYDRGRIAPGCRRRPGRLRRRAGARSLDVCRAESACGGNRACHRERPVRDRTGQNHGQTTREGLAAAGIGRGSAIRNRPVHDVPPGAR